MFPQFFYNYSFYNSSPSQILGMTFFTASIDFVLYASSD
jgi:hypothetical protein